MNMLHTENLLDFLNSFDDKLRIDCIREGCLYSLTLTNTSDQRCRIGDLTLLSAEMPFAPDTKVYGEGYSKLAQYGGIITDCRMTASYTDVDRAPKEAASNFVGGSHVGTEGATEAVVYGAESGIAFSMSIPQYPGLVGGNRFF